MAMGYFDIINESISAVVTTDIETGITYLEPLYKEILRLSEIEFDENIITMEDLYEILKLEVEKRNAMNNSVAIVMRRAEALLEEKVDPIADDENKQLLLNILEYMKESNKLKDREAAVKTKEKAMTVKKSMDKYGINLAKRKE